MNFPSVVVLKVSLNFQMNFHFDSAFNLYFKQPNFLATANIQN